MLQNAQGAYKELARTVELQPENYQARIELANLLILGHNFPQAQEQTDLLMQKRPNDPLVHSLVSSLLAGQGNLSGAIRSALPRAEGNGHCTGATEINRGNAHPISICGIGRDRTSIGSFDPGDPTRQKGGMSVA